MKAKPDNGAFFVATLRAHPHENGGEPYFKDIMPFRQKVCGKPSLFNSQCEDIPIPVYLKSKDMDKWLKGELKVPDQWSPP